MHKIISATFLVACLLFTSTAFSADMTLDKNTAFELTWTDTKKLQAVATFKQKLDEQIDCYKSNNLPGVLYYIDRKSGMVDTLSISPDNPAYPSFANKLNHLEKIVLTYKSGKKWDGYYDPANKLKIVPIANPKNPVILISSDVSDQIISQSRGEELPVMTKR